MRISWLLVFLLGLLFLPSSTQIEVVPGLMKRAKDIYAYFGDQYAYFGDKLGLRKEGEECLVEETPTSLSEAELDEEWAVPKLLHLRETGPDPELAQQLQRNLPVGDYASREFHRLRDSILKRYEDAREQKVVARESPEVETSEYLRILRKSAEDFPSKLKPLEVETKERFEEGKETLKEVKETVKEGGKALWEEGKEKVKEIKKEGKKYAAAKAKSFLPYLWERFTSLFGFESEMEKRVEEIKERTRLAEEEGKEKTRELGENLRRNFEEGKAKVTETGARYLEEGKEETQGLFAYLFQRIGDIFSGQKLKKKAEQGTEKARKMYEEVAQEVEEKYTEAKEQGENLWEKGKEKLIEGASYTGAKLQEGKETIKKVAEEGVKVVGERARRGEEEVKEKLEGGKERIKEEATKAASTITMKLEEGKEKGKEVRKEGMEGLRKLGERAKELQEDVMEGGRKVGRKLREGGRRVGEYLEEKWAESKSLLRGRRGMEESTKTAVAPLRPQEMKEVWQGFMREVPIILKGASDRLKERHQGMLSDLENRHQLLGEEERAKLLTERDQLLKHMAETEKRFSASLGDISNRFDRLWDRLIALQPALSPAPAVHASVSCFDESTSRALGEHSFDLDMEWSVPKEETSNISQVGKDFCSAFEDWGKSLNLACQCTVSPPS